MIIFWEIAYKLVIGLHHLYMEMKRLIYFFEIQNQGK